MGSSDRRGLYRYPIMYLILTNSEYQYSNLMYNVCAFKCNLYPLVVLTCNSFLILEIVFSSCAFFKQREVLKWLRSLPSPQVFYLLPWLVLMLAF